MSDSQKNKDGIVIQKNNMLADEQDTNDGAYESAEMPKEDNNITIQSRNISHAKQDTNTATNNEQEDAGKAQTGTAEAKAPAKKASKNASKPAADLEGEREEGEEKEKNSEGKKICGFIIGKTKGKGTFGKVK